MPRSGPGPVTSAPSSSTRPWVARSRPATMRSSVDLPQPEGPRMVMKSLSATSSVMGCSACVGAAPLRAGGEGACYAFDAELAHASVLIAKFV